MYNSLSLAKLDGDHFHSFYHYYYFNYYSRSANSGLEKHGATSTSSSKHDMSPLGGRGPMSFHQEANRSAYQLFDDPLGIAEPFRDPEQQQFTGSLGHLLPAPFSELVDEQLAPEAATAHAMIKAVRFILVILIGILIMKLLLLKSATTISSSERNNQKHGSRSGNQNRSNGNTFSSGSSARKSKGAKGSSHSKWTEEREDEKAGESERDHLNDGAEPGAEGKANSDDTAPRRSRPRRNGGGGQGDETRNGERTQDSSHHYLSSLKLPPGPTGLPFLGYLPFMSQEIHVTLTHLSQRYGPIYQIYLGGIRVVVLNDASLVRQAFRQPVFSGRPDTQLTRILQGYGIVNSDGALWREQRAFLHSALRKLGAKSLMNGSNGLEAKIQNQVEEFVTDLGEHATLGKSCQVRPIVARAVSSVVGSIVMNLTYKKEKEKFDRLIELMQEGFRLFAIAMPLDFIPIFRFLPGVSYAYQKIKRNRTETSAFFKGFADEHRKYLSENFNLGVSSSSSQLHPNSNWTVEPAEKQSEASVSLAGSLDGNKSLKQEQHHHQQRQQHEVSPGSSKVVVVGEHDEHDGPHDERANSPKKLDTLPSGQAPEGLVGKLKNIRQMKGDNDNEHNSKIDTKQTAFISEETKKQPVELDKIVARDLVDAYIIQQKRHENDGKENYFSDKQLVQIMSDIFSAGLETVTSTIEWSILFMILNPKCQEQVQEEIDQVIGRQRLPQLDDLARMPYTEATIYEVLRRSNVVALGNAHAALDDASIGGYLIPKGTQILPNLYGINMNAKLWNDPDKFDPNRFIVNNKAQKPDYFIPFSVGRRVCLGDLLAKMEVFLFLVGLLQKFDLSVAHEDRNFPPKVEGTVGLSNAPVSFRVALQSRGQKIPQGGI